MRGKYVFIDRDGVINRDGHGRTDSGYVLDREDLEFLPGVLEGLRELKDAGYMTFIISNQQCVGKGIITREGLAGLTSDMLDTIEQAGGKIDGVFYCTHLSDENCHCRKPKTGLFTEAKKKMGLNGMEGSYFIGDYQRDIEAGHRAGLKTILVLSGKSLRSDADAWKIKPDRICDGFSDAVRTVLEEK